MEQLIVKLKQENYEQPPSLSNDAEKELLETVEKALVSFCTENEHTKQLIEIGKDMAYLCERKLEVALRTWELRVRKRGMLRTFKPDELLRALFSL